MVPATLAAPATPPSTYAVFYSASNRPMFKNDSGDSMRLDATVPLVFSDTGVLAVTTGVVPLPVPFAGVIEAVTARLGSANSGTTVVDVNKNGATIFTSTKVSFASSVTPTVGGLSVTAVSSGDYFTVDVDSIGATPGSNLGLAVWIRRTT